MAASIQEDMLRKLSPVLLPSEINNTAQVFQDEDWCGNETKSNRRHYSLSRIDIQTFNLQLPIRLLWFEKPPAEGA